MSIVSEDAAFMKEAIALAEKAAEQGEVPVGAIIVKDGKIIGRGYNLREQSHSAIAHAEILAIENACKELGTWRLNECTLYVTMEPCPMCTGAIINSRIKRVVFGAKDPSAGCCGSLINFNDYPFMHSFDITDGACEEKSAAILRNFFKTKR